jgi:hypothetical protein
MVSPVKISRKAVLAIFLVSATVVLPHTSPIGLLVGVAQLEEEAAGQCNERLIGCGAGEGHHVPGAVSFRGQGGVGALREKIAMIPPETQCFTR